MPELSPGQRSLLAVICLNFDNRMVPARTSPVPRAFKQPLGALRRAGLIEPGCYCPTPAGLALRPQEAPERPLGSRWTGERKQAFLRALERLSLVREALKQVGLSPNSILTLQRVRKGDAEFDQRCTAIIAAARAKRDAAARAPRRSTSKEPQDVERPDPPAPAPASRGSRHVGGEGDHRLEDQTVFRRTKTDEQICAEALAHKAEQARIEALRPPVMDIDTARRELTRRGRRIVCASVYGGSSLRFICSGLGDGEVSAEQLIREAERVVAGRPREDLLPA